MLRDLLGSRGGGTHSIQRWARGQFFGALFWDARQRSSSSLREAASPFWAACLRCWASPASFPTAPRLLQRSPKCRAGLGQILECRRILMNCSNLEDAFLLPTHHILVSFLTFQLILFQKSFMFSFCIRANSRPLQCRSWKNRHYHFYLRVIWNSGRVAGRNQIKGSIFFNFRNGKTAQINENHDGSIRGKTSWYSRNNTSLFTMCSKKNYSNA